MFLHFLDEIWISTFLHCHLNFSLHWKYICDSNALWWSESSSLHSRAAYSYNPESQLYGQNSGGTYFDSQAGGAHVTTVVSSASGGVPPHGMVGIAMEVGSSHIISSGSPYLIHGGSMEGSRNHISHSSRSSSAMVSSTHLSAAHFTTAKTKNTH